MTTEFSEILWFPKDKALFDGEVPKITVIKNVFLPPTIVMVSPDIYEGGKETPSLPDLKEK